MKTHFAREIFTPSYLLLTPTLKTLMQLKSLFIFIIIFGFLANGFAQTDSLKHVLGKLENAGSKGGASQLQTGKVNVVADSAIVSLEKGSRKFKETKGYRIQIFLGTIDQAKSERNKYLSLGLPYSAYTKQVVPEHAVQVGDFTSRMEMERNLEILKKHYPKAFGVVEIIEPPKYNSSKK